MDEYCTCFIVCVADIKCRVKETENINLNEETSIFELKQIIRDTAISIEHLVIEATEQGLGTCWVAWYEQKEIRPLLGIPNDKFVVGVITMGIQMSIQNKGLGRILRI